VSDKEEKQDIGKPIPVLKKQPDQGPQVGPAVDISKEDVTPITRKEIKKVKATDWADLNLTQLHTQLDTLLNRLHYANTIGHQDMINQLTRGITQLRLIIKKKSDEDTRLI